MSWPGQEVSYQPPSAGPKPLLDLSGGKEQGLANDQVRTNIAVEGNARDVSKVNFDQARGLRKDFENVPEVAKYKTIIGQYASALGADNTAEGDQLLINAYAQMLNPTSTVMLGEYQATEQNQTTLDQIRSRIARELKMDNAGRLLPESRRRVYGEMQNLAKTANQSYNLRRKEFSDLAQNYGYEPELVVGQHAGTPFVDRINEYWQSQRESERKDIPTVNGFAKGTQVEFGGDGGGFDRGGFLQSIGLDSQKESVLMAGLNQITGNPELTAEDMLSVYEQAGVPLPDAAAFKQQLAYARQGYRFGPIDTTAQEAEYKTKVDQFAAENDTMGGAVESGLQGVTQGVTFGFGDEIGAGLATALEGGSYSDNLEQERIARDGYRQANPIASYGAEILSSAAIPMGVAKSPMDLARIGGASGALYGMGSSDGNISDRIISGGVGGAIGTVAAPALGKVASIAAPYVQRGGQAVSNFAGNLRNRAAADMPTVDAAGIVRAGADEGVPVPRVMVAPELANKTTAVESTRLGGPVIRGGMQKVSQGIEGRVEALSSGRKLDDEVAGSVLQGAIIRKDASLKSERNRAYTAYQKASGDPPVVPTRAIASIDEKLAKLNNAPGANAAEIAELQSLRSDLSNGKMTVDILRDIRSTKKEGFKANNLSYSKREGRTLEVLDEAAVDIAEALDPKSTAYGLLKKANKLHGEREIFKRNLYKQLIGTDRDLPIDPEVALKTLQRWAKPGGDGLRHIAAWKTLDADEAADLASTMAQTLGRDKGGVFSPALFVSQVEDLSDRARVTAFGPEGKRSIDNLITLSNQFKRVTGTFNNTKSGVAINSSDIKQTALTMFGAAGGSYAGGMTGMALGAGLAMTAMAKNMISARSLMSPDVSKWLVGLSKKPNQQAVIAHLKKLENIAKAEPVIANEVLQLQSTLRDAFASYPERLAAQPPAQEQGAEQPATQRTAGEPQ